MSTNYYVRPAGTPEREEGIHLGKWANGRFTFRAYPNASDRPAEVTWDVTDYASWLRLLDLGAIETEAGRPVTSAEMVTEVQPEPGAHWTFPLPAHWIADGPRRFIPGEFC